MQKSRAKQRLETTIGVEIEGGVVLYGYPETFALLGIDTASAVTYDQSEKFKGADICFAHMGTFQEVSFTSKSMQDLVVAMKILQQSEAVKTGALKDYLMFVSLDTNVFEELVQPTNS